MGDHPKALREKNAAFYRAVEELNLAANTIIAWNTVYMAEGLDVLRADGFAVDDDDLAHVPPTLWSHVNISTEGASSMLRPVPGALDSVYFANRPPRQRRRRPFVHRALG